MKSPAPPHALLSAAVTLLGLAAFQFALVRLAPPARRWLAAGGQGWRGRLLTFWLALIPRLSVWMWLCGLYAVYVRGFAPAFDREFPASMPLWQERFVEIATLLCGLSLLGRLLYLTNRRLRACAAADATHWERILAVLGGESLQIGLPLAAAYVILPLLGFSSEHESSARRVVSICLIGGVGYLCSRLVSLAAEKVRASQAKLDFTTSVRARTLYTQVALLRRMALVVIGFVTLAGMLMLFKSVRQLGTSLLASAGVAGIIAGVAAQRSLANLVAGFQIAVTQPILLEDVVTVEGEVGQIEEITLTYVIVRLPDLRRLVLPISYFLEKPFQNWTRTSPQMIGFVALHLDLLAPLDAIEAEFGRVLAAQPLWNQHTKSFALSETTPQSLELRMSMSADDPDRLSDLKAAVRRAMVDFLRREHPAAWPQVRAELRKSGGSSDGDQRL